jgi:hypothetical protein
MADDSTRVLKNRVGRALVASAIRRELWAGLLDPPARARRLSTSAPMQPSSRDAVMERLSRDVLDRLIEESARTPEARGDRPGLADRQRLELNPFARYPERAMRYEPNPKHKAPWQPGLKGSLCPQDLTEDARQQLLEASAPDPNGGNARYATDGRRAFCAQSHGDDAWHGYPVGWK